MKLWALLEALQPLDPGAEVSIQLRDSSTEDFEVQGVIAGHDITLKINAYTFTLPYDPKVEDLEEELSEKECEIDRLENAARLLLRNLKAPMEGLSAAERTALLNETIEEVEDLL